MKWLALTVLLSLQGKAQVFEIPGNLLVDPHVDAGGSGWQSNGDATIEQVEGNPCFVVRNRGRFQQVATIPSVPPGTHVVFLARASSERINPDGAITGLPYLYGLMLGAERGRILAHLQGQGMRSAARAPNEWTTLWGIFEVPEGTVGIVVELSLAERRGVPQNGSAGRFDDVGLVLFPTLAEARNFVQRYR
jgi:hypothetical protein